MPPAGKQRTPEEVRRDIHAERDGLAASVEELRAAVGRAADLTGKLRARLPVVAAGAFGAGFVLFGGIGAFFRLIFRRGRERRRRDDRG